MTTHRFSPAVVTYLEGHAVDLELAWKLGVRSDRDALVYPFTTPRGNTFKRHRDLADERGVTKQPKDEPLILWWPAGRPSPGAEVLLCEGEPDALAALSALNGDSPAVAALPGTALPVERVTGELAQAATVYLAMDGDKAGRAAAHRIARALQQFTRLRLLLVGEGEDVASRLHAEDDAAGWLAAALEGAPDAPKAKLNEPQGYGRRKKADRLRDLRAKGLDPNTPLPELLERLASTIRQFVVVDEDQATVIAVWMAHAHAIGAADATPYLAVTSAEKRSGKSLLLQVLYELAPYPINTANISDAALFRAVSGETPATLLFDEVDATFGPKARDREDLRAIINAGHRRGVHAYRCVGEGTNQEVARFEVFGPKVLAGIGELPDTVADRSIPIRLRRKAKGEKVTRGRHRNIRAAAEPLRELLEVWAEGAVDKLTSAEPELPEELDDRAQDGAEPLLAIADAAGNPWPARIRDALVRLHGDKAEDADSWGVQLLADCRKAFADEDRLATATLLERLKVDDEAPWLTWGKHGLTPRVLARMLAPYGIKPKAIRIGEETPRGYLRERFEDPWARYLPPVDATERNNPHNGLPERDSGGSQVQPDEPALRFEDPSNPHQQAEVAAVALEAPQPGAHEPEVYDEGAL